ncbi:MAG: alpha/beta hydrolase [Leptolyngbyaceae cyanobacterium SL_7_1]|nr:alpha/beta hydrolase [Leptolyngbyaceae cyanobacterium SL_7_1]
MGESGCWRSLMTLLQPHYRCISVDLLGFGESSKPHIRYDIATLVAFVHQVVESLQLESVTLVGHSLGGWVAAAYALAHRDVAALVLLAPAGIRDDSFCGRYDHLRPLLWQTPVVDWLFWLGSPIARLFNQQTMWNQLRWFRRELNAQPAPRSFLLDRLRPEDAIDTVEQEIHRLQLPTLVIVGEQDETIPLWHCQTYANQIANARLHLLANADHALPQGHARAIAPLILEFLHHSLETPVHDAV